MSATAAGDWCQLVYDYTGDESGESCFVSYGDKFKVSDFRADGMRVVADWETDYGRTGECHQSGGNGAVGYCNYDMREDSKVRFRVLRRDGAEGDDHNRTQWSPWLNIG
ncbi:hypothetical protein ACIQ7D_00445 [Streptomyces sp. NPDC096310]|uniref:hypothetical protein n=1 Tax=Streptomyces sp. NPDC096310 TaxID=3366082 RepID=UPI0037F543E9